MIIKSKRVKAKGAGLKRLLRHVQDGDDNDLVKHVQGNVADLEDARADALRFGREYSIRHWILSPDEEISPAQLAYLIALLAVEFGFDPKLAVVWEHHKPRALGNCNQHFHLLVREVDAITGGVLSNSHNFKRHEKLARQLEVVWKHKLTRGSHNRAVAGALTGTKNADVVTAMTAAGLLDAARPFESFDEDQHQRAKREGLDLPQLSIMISEALSGSNSQTEFETKLASVGLRIGAGKKADTPIIETLDHILVGSLARLTRLRKAALLERLKFNVGKKHAAETHDSAGDVSTVETRGAGNGPDCQTGGADRGSGSTAPDDGSNRTASASGGGHRADLETAGIARISPGRSCHDESLGGRRAQLVFTLGCATYQGQLLDLLAVARRTAQDPLERVIGDLNDSIEQNTFLVSRALTLPEPASLEAARDTEKTCRQQLRRLEAEADATLQELSALPRSSIWRRFWFRREARTRKELNDKLTKQSASAQRAAREHATSQNSLDAEITSFNVARSKHEVESARRLETAKWESSIAVAAKTFVVQNPQFATWGSPRLIQVAAQIEKIRSDHDSPEAYHPRDRATVFLPF
jgi:hypothetical protein